MYKVKVFLIKFLVNSHSRNIKKHKNQGNLCQNNFHLHNRNNRKLITKNSNLINFTFEIAQLQPNIHIKHLLI